MEVRRVPIALEKSPKSAQIVLYFYKKCLKFRNSARKLLAVTLFYFLADVYTYALQCGVPQSSILGPILYLLYTSLLSDIVKKFNLSFYADDSQLYLSFQPSIPGDRVLAVSNIER